MLKRYNIKIKLKYNFNLSAETKKEIEDNVNLLINQATILNLPGVKNKKKIKIREIKRRKKDETNN